MLSGEATITNCIVFGVTQTGLDPTIYRTRDEHANYYTTDVVKSILEKRTERRGISVKIK